MQCCAIKCAFVATSQDALEDHVRSCVRVINYCDTCYQYSTDTKMNLKYHKYYCKSIRGKKTECPTCKKTYSKNYYRHHTCKQKSDAEPNNSKHVLPELKSVAEDQLSKICSSMEAEFLNDRHHLLNSSTTPRTEVLAKQQGLTRTNGTEFHCKFMNKLAKQYTEEYSLDSSDFDRHKSSTNSGTIIRQEISAISQIIGRITIKQLSDPTDPEKILLARQGAYFSKFEDVIEILTEHHMVSETFSTDYETTSASRKAGIMRCLWKACTCILKKRRLDLPMKLRLKKAVEAYEKAKKYFLRKRKSTETKQARQEDRHVRFSDLNIYEKLRNAWEKDVSGFFSSGCSELLNSNFVEFQSNNRCYHIYNLYLSYISLGFYLFTPPQRPQVYRYMSFFSTDKNHPASLVYNGKKFVLRTKFLPSKATHYENFQKQGFPDILVGNEKLNELLRNLEQFQSRKLFTGTTLSHFKTSSLLVDSSDKYILHQLHGPVIKFFISKYYPDLNSRIETILLRDFRGLAVDFYTEMWRHNDSGKLQYRLDHLAKQMGHSSQTQKKYYNFHNREEAAKEMSELINQCSTQKRKYEEIDEVEDGSKNNRIVNFRGKVAAADILFIQDNISEFFDIEL